MAKAKTQLPNCFSKNATFSFETEIKAELLEYSFYVYLFKGKDSVLIKEQNEVICGDIFLIYGQSNALANDSVEVARFNGKINLDVRLLPITRKMSIYGYR